MVNPMALMSMMPKVEGFAPLPSSAAKAAMVWQTHDMMFIGGLAWNWSGRLVKALSNDAFNELNGRKKVELGGAPIDQQVLATSIKDGLFQLAKPYLDASKKQFESTLEHNDKIQDKILKASFDLEMKKVQYNYDLIKSVPKEFIELLVEDFTGTKRSGDGVEFGDRTTSDGKTSGDAPTFELTEEEKEKIRNKKNTPTTTSTPKPPPKQTTKEVSKTLFYSYEWRDGNGKQQKNLVKITLTLEQAKRAVKINEVTLNNLSKLSVKSSWHKGMIRLKIAQLSAQRTAIKKAFGVWV